MSFRLYRTPGAYRSAIAEVKLLEQLTVKIGFPAGKPIATASSTGSGHEPFKDMAEVASIALVNDSSRPFLNPAVIQGKKRISAAYLQAARKVFEKSITAEAGAAIVGEAGAAVVKKYIRDNPHKPIQAATAKRKGSTKPLIDTGQMLNSVTYKVD